MRALLFFVADFGIQPFLPQRNRQRFAEFFGCVRILSFLFMRRQQCKEAQDHLIFF